MPAGGGFVKRPTGETTVTRAPSGSGRSSGYEGPERSVCTSETREALHLEGPHLIDIDAELIPLMQTKLGQGTAPFQMRSGLGLIMCCRELKLARGQSSTQKFDVMIVFGGRSMGQGSTDKVREEQKRSKLTVVSLNSGFCDPSFVILTQEKKTRDTTRSALLVVDWVAHACDSEIPFSAINSSWLEPRLAQLECRGGPVEHNNNDKPQRIGTKSVDQAGPKGRPRLAEAAPNMQKCWAAISLNVWGHLVWFRASLSPARRAVLPLFDPKLSPHNKQRIGGLIRTPLSHTPVSGCIPRLPSSSHSNPTPYTILYTSISCRILSSRVNMKIPNTRNPNLSIPQKCASENSAWSERMEFNQAADGFAMVPQSSVDEWKYPTIIQEFWYFEIDASVFPDVNLYLQRSQMRHGGSIWLSL
ncbi:hypothetical protein GGX14DRAFT_661046 [Mycena pura]|uniref:Uncharacterized protein n=1 Tax=Mycena pura TaxID=153505 RepID=A0AAD6Y3W9_9AGAR|nr:hypothetical protein GGX14DRAFT_661046 [Mycena pura]